MAEKKVKKPKKKKEEMWYAPLASAEEAYINWWLQELIKAGYVKEVIYEPKSFELSKPVKLKKTVELKTKSKEKEVHLLHDHHYTPDFKVIWNKKAEGVFFYTRENVNLDLPFLGEPFLDTDNVFYSYVEVKPTHDMQNMVRAFRINQKWVYKEFKELMNLTIPDGKKNLFASTFTPLRYLYCNIDTKKLRKIDFKVVTLSEYLKKFNA